MTLRSGYVWAALVACLSFTAAFAGNTPQMKDWTLLVFMNGNNSLDDMTTTNLLQMEKIGSTANVNVVVEWASEASKDTKRLLVQKSSDSSKVTSPILQTLPQLDMGDYHELEQFLEWGVNQFPARHYFVDVWDHGMGWHSRIESASLHTMDISYDNNTGHEITTPQLGLALDDMAKLIGHKIDIVGTDACLMAMAEVGSEIADSTNYLVASEEVEPGPGWPYDQFLQGWFSRGLTESAQIGAWLSQAYVDSYKASGERVTMSVLDLSQEKAMESTLSELGNQLRTLSADEDTKVVNAGSNAISFTSYDYVDLKDLVAQIGSANVTALDPKALAEVQARLSTYVVANHDSSNVGNAGGVSIWWPKSNGVLQQYLSSYQQLKFWNTGWGDALEKLFPQSPSSSHLLAVGR